jgi:hypothetical protein
LKTVFFSENPKKTKSSYMIIRYSLLNI